MTNPLSSESSSRASSFRSALSVLCIAAGPPAPSFSAAHLDAAAALVLGEAADAAATAAAAATPGLSLEQRAQMVQADAQKRAADAFAAIESHLSADMRATPLSVRAMLWELLVRLCERSAAIAQSKQTAQSTAPTRPAGAALASSSVRDEWYLLLAPQLYRLVTLVVPKGTEEDASPNVPLTIHTLRRWMAAAEASTGTVPAATAATAAAAVRFKKHQLVNALKYVESYTFVPPQRSEAELAAAQEAKRERKRRRREKEQEERRRHKRSKRNGQQQGGGQRSDSSSSPSRSVSPSAGNAATAAAGSSVAPSAAAAAAAAPAPDRSRSRSSSRSSTGSVIRLRSPSSSVSPTTHRYRNRLTGAPAHTASEEAYATRFLEQIRASQKRAHVEGTLRPAGESMLAWEEWAETVAHVRESVRKQKREANSTANADATTQAVLAGTAENLVLPVPHTSAGSSLSTSAPVPPAADAAVASSPAAPACVPVSSFLSSWLSCRNHWQATRDDAGESFNQTSEGGTHPSDRWLDHLVQCGATLPSQLVPQGAQRTWSKLHEHNAASARVQGPLLPRPIPMAAMRYYEQAQPTQLQAQHTQL